MNEYDELDNWAFDNEHDVEEKIYGDEEVLETPVLEVDDEDDTAEDVPYEPVAWPKSLGKYGRLGAKCSDPRVYSRGENVELLLTRAGWNGNVFTEEFANEVRQIQEENNLPATGRVDQKTWNVIVNG